MRLIINNIHEKHNYNNKFWQRVRFQFIQLIGWNRLLPLSNSNVFKTNAFNRELKNHDEIHDDDVCWLGKDGGKKEN